MQEEVKKLLHLFCTIYEESDIEEKIWVSIWKNKLRIMFFSKLVHFDSHLINC